MAPVSIDYISTHVSYDRYVRRREHVASPDSNGGAAVHFSHDSAQQNCGVRSNVRNGCLLSADISAGSDLRSGRLFFRLTSAATPINGLTNRDKVIHVRRSHRTCAPSRKSNAQSPSDLHSMAPLRPNNSRTPSALRFRRSLRTCCSRVRS